MHRRKFIGGTVGALAAAVAIPWKKKSQKWKHILNRWDPGRKYSELEVDKALTDISLQYIQESEALFAKQVFPIVASDGTAEPVTIHINKLQPNDYVTVSCDANDSSSPRVIHDSSGWTFVLDNGHKVSMS